MRYSSDHICPFRAFGALISFFWLKSLILPYFCYFGLFLNKKPLNYLFVIMFVTYVTKSRLKDKKYVRVETKGSWMERMYQQSARALARVFSFDVKFKGTKRTMFYRKLFGFSARSRRMDMKGEVKIYVRSYPGLLAIIPHVKLGKSVLAVPIQAAPRLKSFFRNPMWQPIELHTFDAILSPDARLQAMDRALATSNLGEVTLKEEIAALQQLLYRGKASADVVERVAKALRAVRELAALDWSDGKEFSTRLEAQLAPLRKVMR